jgi:hypothetical protein
VNVELRDMFLNQSVHLGKGEEAMLNKNNYFYNILYTKKIPLETKLNFDHSYYFSLGINNKIVKYLIGNCIFETNMILVVIFRSPKC